MDVKQGRLVAVEIKGVWEWRVEFPTKRGTLAISPFDAPDLDETLRKEKPRAGLAIDVDLELKNGKPVRIRPRGARWTQAPAPLPGVPVGPSSSGVHVSRVDVSYTISGSGRRQDIGAFHLSNGQSPALRDVDIAEKATAQGAPVQRHNGKWRRTDYFAERPGCYPFNFVRALLNPPPEATPVSGADADAYYAALLAKHPECDHARYVSGCHTGRMEVELLCLSPTIVSHPPGADHLLSHAERQAIEAVFQVACRQGPAVADSPYGPTDIDRHDSRLQALQRIRPPAQVAPGRYVLPATSLKGMLRQVVEMLTHSYSPFVSEDLKGKDPKYLDHRLEGRWIDASGIVQNGRWRHPDAVSCGIRSQDDVTQYTYDFQRQGNHIGYWRRWVPAGSTPYAKLEHVNAEEHPDGTSLADRLFGRVASAEKRPSWAGRVRVHAGLGWDEEGKSTAQAASEYWFLKPLTRPAGAKAKCEALYLLPGTAGQVMKYNDSQSEFRGRKWYWAHSLGGPGQQSALSLADVLNKIRSAADPFSDPAIVAAVDAFRQRVWGHRHSQAATKSWLKPLLPGSRFRFSIDFMNLSGVELGALLGAITLFNEPGKTPKHCHRLGRAKPLGFGSVVLQVKKLQLLNVGSAWKELTPFDECWMVKEEEVRKVENGSLKALDSYCTAWKNPVWEQLKKVSRIPAALTDYDYWKNWSDFRYSPAAVPLPVP